MTEPSNVHPMQPAKRFVGPDNVRPLVEVHSPDYGDGHIAALVGHGVQIYWNTPLIAGLAEHLLVHDRAWVEKLEMR